MPNAFYLAFDTELPPGARRGGDDHRTAFQVDRDRVIFSYAFRRLQSKTQVFQAGQFDFYRTRLTHSIEVARLGQSICGWLALHPPLGEAFCLDRDLVEAVGLAHDLGHPPFGHIGERRLHELLAPYGGFEGNAQTLRIVCDLFYERHGKPRGLSPTRAFLDGILKYKRLRREAPEAPNHYLYDDQAEVLEFVAGGTGERGRSLECQVMDWADDTAYGLHDLIDGVHAGFLTPRSVADWAGAQSLSDLEVPVVEGLLHAMSDGNLEAEMAVKVGRYVRGCRLVPHASPLAALTHRHAWRLEVDPACAAEVAVYKRLAVDIIFRSPTIQQMEFKGALLLSQLWEALWDHYRDGRPRLRLLPASNAAWLLAADDEAGRARRLCDYLASLTDGQALRLHRRLFAAEAGPLHELL